MVFDVVVADAPLQRRIIAAVEIVGLSQYNLPFTKTKCRFGAVQRFFDARATSLSSLFLCTAAP